MSALILPDIGLQLRKPFALNEANAEVAAKLLREILQDNLFTVFECRYSDGANPHLNVDVDEHVYKGSLENPEYIEIVKRGTPCRAIPGVFDHTYIAFSAGGYFYCLDAAEGESEDHDDYYKAVLRFGTDRSLAFEDPAWKWVFEYRGDRELRDGSNRTFRQIRETVTAIEGPYVEWWNRAPAGAGHLHRHILMPTAPLPPDYR